MNLFAKQKEILRHRKQVTTEERWGSDKLRVRD